MWDASLPIPHSPLPDGIMFCRSLLLLHNSQSTLWNVCLSVVTKMMSKPESQCSELPAYIFIPNPTSDKLINRKPRGKKNLNEETNVFIFAINDCLLRRLNSSVQIEGPCSFQGRF